MTEDQVLAEFLTNFSDVDKDGTINRQVFIIFTIIIENNSWIAIKILLIIVKMKK